MAEYPNHGPPTLGDASVDEYGSTIAPVDGKHDPATVRPPSQDMPVPPPAPSSSLSAKMLGRVGGSTSIGFGDGGAVGGKVAMSGATADSETAVGPSGCANNGVLSSGPTASTKIFLGSNSVKAASSSSSGAKTPSSINIKPPGLNIKNIGLSSAKPVGLGSMKPISLSITKSGSVSITKSGNLSSTKPAGPSSCKPVSLNLKKIGSSSSNSLSGPKSLSLTKPVGSSSSTKTTSSGANKSSGGSNSKPMKSHLIQLVSESPFVVRIRKYSSIPRRGRGRPSFRPSSSAAAATVPLPVVDETTTRSGRAVRTVKRRSYESSDEDEELQFDDSSVRGHDHGVGRLPAHKRARTAPPQSSRDATAEATVEAPPPGVLTSLWYSREECLHVFVIEKILSWKRRHTVEKVETTNKEGEESKTKMEGDGESATEDAKKKHDESSDIPAPSVPQAKYEKLSERVLSHLAARRDSRRRMDVSRINPYQCPLLLASVSTSADAPPPYRYTDAYEEVLLIKWRGRSHAHCSWERPSDLVRLDPSNTAKQKIRRFIALQQATLGHDWKEILESESRGNGNDGNGNGNDGNGNGNGNSDNAETADATSLALPPGAAADEEEEAESPVPSEYLEVERILACDESEMDMSVFDKQAKVNAAVDRDLLADDDAAGKGRSSAAVLVLPPQEAPWDPEDNVRYVVKWKGLQASDLTWEYWRDIKHDGVEPAMHFWKRQRPPPLETVRADLCRPLPTVKDFVKLQTSPRYGAAKRDGDGSTENGDPSALYLRGYQLEGVNWLLWNWFNRRSCILADEMGLGKTIQSVGFLAQLCEKTRIRAPFMVVAPLSLISQWQSESVTWAPNLNVIVYHGSADARDFLVKQEFYYNEQFVGKQTCSKLKRMNYTKFQLLITTYEVVLKDMAVLSKIRWRCLIVDEAHRLKNAKSRLFLELGSIPRDFCLLLTGTPLQNSTEELWALLYFSDPQGFASKEQFVEKFGQLTDAKQVRDLHTILKPYLLRRVKEDVEKSLPPKEETILEVTLTPIQKTYYKAIYEKNTTFLFKGAKPSNAPSLMNIMMELRKCCNHPFLIRGVEERILTDAAQTLKQKDAEANIDNLKLLSEHLVTSSGKMVLLSKLLPKLKDGGHKVLIFSQMVRVLDLLEELLRLKQYRYERLDGSTSASVRAAAVDRFGRRSCQKFVMLLSTRAGGLGLNLTAADTVVIYDSDWNPQNDLQAMARAHRIGQTRAVRVYRLLTAKTYEMHMFHSASMKLGLDRAVLAHQRHHTAAVEDESGSGASKRTLKSEREIQAREIDELLKKGAYDVFRDEVDDKESKQFMETDIDSLLERSSRRVTYGNTDSSISSGLGSFSKASFVASSGDGEDIDLDDPDFWKKAVGLEAPAVMATGEGDYDDVGGKKRNRKQVQVFDPYAAFAEAEQRKHDKIVAKAKEEKEEKERQRQEKKKKKEEEKEKRKREREEAKEAKDKRFHMSSEHKKQKFEDKYFSEEKKAFKEGKNKKLKKAERRKIMRQIENEDPILERLKQAWEVPQRDRATSAALRFGFGRHCKVRQESNLVSLPIQDLEVFLREYLFQLGLQASVCVLNSIRPKSKSPDQPDEATLNMLSTSVLRELIHMYGKADGEWICFAIQSSLTLHNDVKRRRRMLRLPLTLTEESFVSELRAGAAIRALRRFAFLARLTKLVGDALDRVLSELGHEELGKRGCPTKDLTTLDVDLKARHVTTEELSHSIGISLDVDVGDELMHNLAPWWDRACDVSLIIGTFIHGLGNYDAMQKDINLPFGFKISQYSLIDVFASQAYHNYDASAQSVRKVFDDSINLSKPKGDEVVSATILQTNGSTEKKGDRIMGMENEKKLSSQIIKLENGDSEDLGKVTLARISAGIMTAVRSNPRSFIKCLENKKPKKAKKERKKKVDSSGNETTSKRENEVIYPTLLPWNQRLPMPDSSLLDQHLLMLTDNLEKNTLKAANKANESAPEKIEDSITCDRKQSKDDKKNEAHVESISINFELWLVASRDLNKSRTHDCLEKVERVSGYVHGLREHGLSLYGKTSCSDVAFIMNGDTPRYKRDTAVPLSFTKYCLNALAMSDENIIRTFVSSVKKFKKQVKEEEKKAKVSTSTAETASNSTTVLSAAPAEDQIKGKHRMYFLSVIPDQFKASADERAKICLFIIQNGPPVFEGDKSFSKVSLNVWSALFGDEDGEDDVPERQFLTPTHMIDSASMSSASTDSSQILLCQSYINHALLPLCFGLCVQGIEPNKKGNVQKIGLNKKATRKSPIPDPCIPLFQHSSVAANNALAILRRTRLMKAIRFIVGGGVPGELIFSFLRGPSMRRDLGSLPVWWCPWIHDLALLVYAATCGLFAVIIDRNRKSERYETHRVFGKDAVRAHIRRVFLDGRDGVKPALPRSFLKGSSEEAKEMWLEMHAYQFPGVHVIERRLAFICAELTAKAASMSARNKMAEWRYDNLPMFDHGGWPRNDDIGCMFSCNGNGTISLSKSLLCTVEDQANNVDEDDA